MADSSTPPIQGLNRVWANTMNTRSELAVTCGSGCAANHAEPNSPTAIAPARHSTIQVMPMRRAGGIVGTD